MKRFLKFVATSLVGGTVDMVLVWLLSGYVFSGYWGEVVVTPMISFECSVIIGFIVHPATFYVEPESLSTAEYDKNKRGFTVSTYKICL